MTAAATLTKSQRERRQRILTSALELASEGGFDGVQMREVASAADVALGTLYRYFPSKEALLVSAMTQSVFDLRARLAQKPPRGADAVERVVDVLQRANRYLLSRPPMAEAMVKALATTDPDVGIAVREVREAMNDIITDAMHPGVEPSERDRTAGRILAYVWLSSLVSWITGVEPATRVDDDLATAAALLIAG